MYESVEPKLASWLRFERNPFGSHLVARLDGRIDPRRLEAMCRAEGLVVAAMDNFSVEPTGDERLILGYATHTPHKLIDAADKLAGILRRF
ncbi:MAG TPA: hypothetical protein VFF48_09780 [Brevundimonas sp.]|nr:hypothetical protein [Brevundimonas sp.]